MPRVSLTPNLARHVKGEPLSVPGDTVKQVIHNYFTQQPAVRDYVLDERGHVRTHMIIFLDGVAIKDRETLSDAVQADSEVFIMQSLTGG